MAPMVNRPVRATEIHRGELPPCRETVAQPPSTISILSRPREQVDERHGLVERLVVLAQCGECAIDVSTLYGSTQGERLEPAAASPPAHWPVE